MAKNRAKKNSGGIVWSDLPQARVDLRAAAGNPKRAAVLAGRIMAVFGSAGAQALLNFLNAEDAEHTPSAETRRVLAKALLAAPEGIAASVEYWPSLADGAKLQILQEKLPPEFLPLCLETAESTNPGLKLYLPVSAWPSCINRKQPKAC